MNLRQLSFGIRKIYTQTKTDRHTHRHFSKNDFFSCFECSIIRICNNLEHDFFCHHHTSISLRNMEVKLSPPPSTVIFIYRKFPPPRSTSLFIYRFTFLQWIIMMFLSGYFIYQNQALYSC